MNKKIRRRCKCGCGKVASPGRQYIHNHHRIDKKHSKKTKKKMSLSAKNNINSLGCKRSKETKLKMSLAQQNRSEEHKLKISLRNIGNIYGRGNKGKKRSKETKLQISLAQIKYDPNYQYCDIWKDKEYKNDLRKNYCENANCKNKSKRFVNHHIHLDKKRCAPNEVMTLCDSCHAILHRLLEIKYHIPVNPKDYIIINRPDHISYINKETRKIVKITRKM